MTRILHAFIGTGLTVRHKLINASVALVVPSTVALIRLLDGKFQPVDVVIVPLLTICMYTWVNYQSQKDIRGVH